MPRSMKTAQLALVDDGGEGDVEGDGEAAEHEGGRQQAEEAHARAAPSRGPFRRPRPRWPRRSPRRPPPGLRSPSARSGQRPEADEGLAGERLADGRGDEDLVGRRGGAEPRGEVHDPAEHGEVEPVAGADRAHDYLAGGDAEADVQVPVRMLLEQIGERTLDLQAAGDGVAFHFRPCGTATTSSPMNLSTSPSWRSTITVCASEVLVQHLDHDLGRDRLGEGGVAADVGEQHRGARALAAARDAGGLGGVDRGDGPAGDELHQLEPFAEIADHRVHAAGEVADLVAGPHPSTLAERSPPSDPGGDLADLQDRAGQAPGEEQRRRGGDAEAGEADEQQVAQHVVDDGVGVLLAELGDDRPGKASGKA